MLTAIIIILVIMFIFDRIDSHLLTKDTNIMLANSLNELAEIKELLTEIKEFSTEIKSAVDDIEG